MQKSKLAFRLAAVLAFSLVMSFAAVQAHATAISYNTRAAFDAAFATAAVETWDTFTAPTVISDGATVNGITYNTSAGVGGALVTDLYITTTGLNGLGGSILTYFDSPDTITFAFATPITAFGIDVNVFSPFDGAFQATTSLGDVALSFYDPFPGFATGQFLGFSSSASFNAVTIGLGPNGDAAYDAYTLDTLRQLPQAAVPVPPSLLLLGSGLAGLGFLRSRKFKL